MCVWFGVLLYDLYFDGTLCVGIGTDSTVVEDI
jgi:hypothetical protein